MTVATEALPAERLDAVDPPPSAWLPLTAADVAGGGEERQPEHAWPGSLFIFLANLMAFGMGLGAVGASIGAVVSLFQGEWARAGLVAAAAVGLGLGSLVQRALGKHLSRFTRWGWYGAMGELGVASLAKVNAMVMTGDAGGALFGLVVDVLWMRYFWNRREDFGIDLEI